MNYFFLQGSWWGSLHVKWYCRKKSIAVKICKTIQPFWRTFQLPWLAFAHLSPIFEALHSCLPIKVTSPIFFSRYGKRSNEIEVSYSSCFIVNVHFMTSLTLLTTKAKPDPLPKNELQSPPCLYHNWIYGFQLTDIS